METCGDHISEHPELSDVAFEPFEQMCLEQDGLALVEYARLMMADGCVLDFATEGRRRTQILTLVLSDTFASNTCTFEDLNSFVSEVVCQNLLFVFVLQGA
jgi:hypothetical protein